MSLFHEPQCPYCGSTLPTRALWDFARLEQAKVITGLGFLGRSGLLRGKIGLACPNCRTKLKIVQTRIVLVRALVWGAFLAGVAWFGIWRRQSALVLDQRLLYALLLVAYLIILWLQRVSTPYLAHVRPVRDDEKLSYPLRSAYEGPAGSDD
jgi:hypothetical protein